MNATAWASAASPVLAERITEQRRRDQADRAETPIFMIAGEGRMHAGLRRQVGRRAGNRLEPWLLVIGDDRNPLSFF
jgi:hypothetical protein